MQSKMGMRLRAVGAVTLGLMLAVAAAGCGSAEPDAAPGAMAETAPAPVNGVTAGAHRKMGQGEAWAWVKAGADGKVSAVGLSFTEAALQGLPKDAPAVCCGGPEFSLPMPEKVAAGGYTHAVINWNPVGHPPAGVYDKPHFDFHFYLISEAARLAISAAGADEACCMKPVATDAVPAGYVEFPPAVPQMGVHWGNPQAEEFQGVPFTKTFIFGSYNGAVTFLEPMVSLAFLESHPAVKVPVAQPKTWTAENFLPGEYSVAYDADTKVYSLALETAVAADATAPIGAAAK